MTNLTLESADDLVRDLRIRDDRIDCPICGRSLMVSENAEGSAFWTHFFSKKHTPERPVDPSLEDSLREIIVRTARQAKRDRKAVETASKKARREARAAEDRRLKATHKVTGAFLDDIVDEMEGLISMMEPYYAQSNAGDSAREMIAEIRKMSGQPHED